MAPWALPSTLTSAYQMATSKLVVASGEEVSCVVTADIDKRLDRGLSPQDVCAHYFGACRDEDCELWIATLHLSKRVHPTSEDPGPFCTCNW